MRLIYFVFVIKVSYSDFSINPILFSSELGAYKDWPSGTNDPIFPTRLYDSKINLTTLILLSGNLSYYSINSASLTMIYVTLIDLSNSIMESFDTVCLNARLPRIFQAQLL